MLVGETADTGLRAFLTCGGFAAYCWGILLVYALGASYGWDIVAFSGIVLPALSFIAFFLLPESPVWLVKQKKVEKARKALLWLRGGDAEQVKEHSRGPILACFGIAGSSLGPRANVVRQLISIDLIN